MGSGLQNPNLSFEELFKQAKEAAPLLQDTGMRMIVNLRQRHPGLFDDVQFELGPIKTPERAQQKIVGDYRGDASQISDLARGRLVIQTPEQIAAIRAYLEERGDAIGVEKFKDRFALPGDTHFRDINLKVRMPNGHVVELRVEQRDLLDAAKLTHQPYERVQEIDRFDRRITAEEETERIRLMDSIQQTHDEAAGHASLDALLSDEGRRMIAQDTAARVARDAVRTTPVSLTEEFGKRSGMIGGTIVAGALYASDADAGEIAAGTAEAVVPGVSSAIALQEGRLAEAAMRGVEEIPVAGIIASEIARPILRGGGFDLDPSIGQMLLGIKAEVNPDEQRFMRVFDGLPDMPADDMPPEIASLVELKRAVLQGEQKLTLAGDPQGRLDATRDLEAVQARYSEQYDELARSGSLSEVEGWIAEQNAGSMMQPLPTPPRDIGMTVRPGPLRPAPAPF